MVLVGEGDITAFRRLFEKYKGPIMSYAFRFVGRKNVAEEITQEVFLSVYRARENYARQAKFTTWLWTIARNACIDFLRKKGEIQLDNEDLPPLDELTGDSFTPEAEAAMMRQADRAAIEKCLGGLSQSQRESISLRTFSDLSYEEIGETLHLSLASVKSLIFRAKQSLLSCLKECGYGTP